MSKITLNMNKINIRFGIIWLILIISIPVLLGIGWVRNVIKFCKLDFQAPYKAEIIRGVGLTPLGTIIGWIDIKDN